MTKEQMECECVFLWDDKGNISKQKLCKPHQWIYTPYMKKGEQND